MTHILKPYRMHWWDQSLGTNGTNKCHQYVLVLSHLLPLVWLFHFSTLQTYLFHARANMMLGSSQSNSFFLPALGRKIPGKDSSCHSISHMYISGAVISVTSLGHHSGLGMEPVNLKNGGKTY